MLDCARAGARWPRPSTPWSLPAAPWSSPLSRRRAGHGRGLALARPAPWPHSTRWPPPGLPRAWRALDWPLRLRWFDPRRRGPPDRLGAPRARSRRRGSSPRAGLPSRGPMALAVAVNAEQALAAAAAASNARASTRSSHAPCAPPRESPPFRLRDEAFFREWRRARGGGGHRRRLGRRRFDRRRHAAQPACALCARHPRAGVPGPRRSVARDRGGAPGPAGRRFGGAAMGPGGRAHRVGAAHRGGGRVGGDRSASSAPIPRRCAPTHADLEMSDAQPDLYLTTEGRASIARFLLAQPESGALAWMIAVADSSELADSVRARRRTHRRRLSLSGETLRRGRVSVDAAASRRDRERARSSDVPSRPRLSQHRPARADGAPLPRADARERARRRRTRRGISPASTRASAAGRMRERCTGSSSTASQATRTIATRSSAAGSRRSAWGCSTTPRSISAPRSPSREKPPTSSRPRSGWRARWTRSAAPPRRATPPGPAPSSASRPITTAFACASDTSCRRRGRRRRRRSPSTPT